MNQEPVTPTKRFSSLVGKLSMGGPSLPAVIELDGSATTGMFLMFSMNFFE